MQKNKKEPEMRASDISTVEKYAQKKKRFVIEGLSEYAVRYDTSNKYLAEAIEYSTSIRNISVGDGEHRIKKVICEGVLKNHSIDSLTFRGTTSFEGGALEVIGQIFKNNRIRSVHFDRVEARTEVIDPLVRYIADNDSVERVLMSEISAIDSTNYLFGCLRNKNVKKFAFTQSSITGQQFGFLLQYISNSNVTNFHFGTKNRNSQLILDPLAAVPNSIKKLKLSNNLESLDSFLLAMRENKTIEDLRIENDSSRNDLTLIPNAENVQALLVASKTLKSLSMADLSQTNHIINGIIVNTSLTALDLTVWTRDNYKDLCEAIYNHSSIEKAKIRSIQSPDHFLAVKLLENNKITDLDISGTADLDEDILNAICERITENKILQRIKMTLDTVALEKNQLFWDTMTKSTSLYCFEIDYSCSRPFISTIWRKIEAVLEANLGITSIGKIPDIPPKVAQLLAKNHREVAYGVNRTTLLVKMMARRSDPFTEKLPLEIWLMILRKICYRGFNNVKFDEMLRRESQ